MSMRFIIIQYISTCQVDHIKLFFFDRKTDNNEPDNYIHAVNCVIDVTQRTLLRFPLVSLFFEVTRGAHYIASDRQTDIS